MGKFITLCEGHAPGQFIMAEKAGTGEPANFVYEPGVLYPVVPDDSRDFGIGETMAQSLVDSRRFEFAEKPAEMKPKKAGPPSDEGATSEKAAQ